jgi:thiol-disulfide isomerase/thioredoxin
MSLIRVIRTASAVAAVALSASVAHAQDNVGIALGAKAPGAAVETLDGKRTDLANYIGKSPVVLEFWATWCGNCKELEPTMESVAKKYSGKVRFVGVAVSVNQSPDRIKLYAQKYGISHDIVYDRDGHAVDAYDVPATSYVVVIDRGGKVVYTGLGGEQDLDAAVRKAL